MRFSYHRLPRGMFDALAAGGGGPDAVRQLAAAQYSKHLLLLRGVVDTSLSVGHGQARIARFGYDLLTDVQRQDPAAADAVIRHPSVGAWALRTLRALRGDPAMPGAEPRGLCAVAAAAAIRARLPAEIEVLSVGEVVVLPSLGAAQVDNGTATVRSAAGGAEIASAGMRVEVPDDPHQDAPGWLAVRRLRAGSLDVLIDDVDPFRMPADATVARRRRAVDLDQWDAIIQDTWPLVARDHPVIAEELVAAIRVIVPLTTPPRGQVSSSSSETFGAVALSRPSDSSTFAVTLVHEVQHLKLSALLDVVTLTLPGDRHLFYAPWREDPRPIGGLLQGAYAYLGVSRFWRRQRHLDNGAAELRAHAEFARWRAAAAMVVETLQSTDRLTPAGLEFVQGMAGTLRRWQDESVPEDAQVLARLEADEHLARWQSSNGPLHA
jgi:uncharacterized protein